MVENVTRERRGSHETDTGADQPRSERWRRIATDPRWLSAVLATAVRMLVSRQAWVRNELVSSPGLDGEYYLTWAAEIAAGDVFGTGGSQGGEPFLLNPLYAYVLAPIAGVLDGGAAPVLALQALLAGGTAWLAAAAALRFAGRAAAWVAGLGVAFSSALVHLDTHVSVSGLAAFLVAGACFALSPPPPGDPRGRGHGPVAAGIWLGLGALARPVAMLAVPFAAWMYLRGEAPGRRRAAAVLVVFGAFALASFVRNVAVSGEPVVFTAANGHNLHLGNNPDARRLRTMITHDFGFAPRTMHRDSKFRVAHERGREPTRTEVSSWYRDRALRELADHFGPSVVHYGHKLRWFFGPAETPSSADRTWDLRSTPLLRLGFVPTWLLACLAGAGAVLAVRRREALLGPGALVLAHVAACTLAFPLSHYRSPAVPAMAVLAAAGIVEGTRAIRSGRSGRAVLGVAVVLVLAVAGSVGPQPGYLEYKTLANSAAADVELGFGSHDPGERAQRARRARENALAAHALEPGNLQVLDTLTQAELLAGDLDAAERWAAKLADLAPWSPTPHVGHAEIAFQRGAHDRALAIIQEQIARYPWSRTLEEQRRSVEAAIRRTR